MDTSRFVIKEGAERRRKKRFPFWAAVSVNEVNTNEVASTSGFSNTESFASCVNICEDGMFLESFEKFREGSVLSLEITLPREDDHANFRFLGRVVHSRRRKKSSVQGFGVKFLNRPRNMSVFFG
jgi:hypothetical protein